MTGHMPEKYSYRITDPGEALGYADIASTKDRSMKWAVISADLDLSEDEQHHMSIQDRNNHDKNKKKILNGKAGIYTTQDFKIILLPPHMSSSMHSPKIEQVCVMEV